jgi:hypothetical protein
MGEAVIHFCQGPPERIRGVYDWNMCSRAEWDKLRRRVEDAVESEDLRHLMSEAAARVEALIDEIKAWACASESGEWRGRSQRRSPPEWVV